MGEGGVTAIEHHVERPSRESIVKEIATNSHYRRALRYRGLTVMEVYTSYWGPCSCVFNKLQGIYKELLDRPIKLVAAECDKIEALQDYIGKSKPHFLIYRQDKLLETVEGVNTPLLDRVIMDNAPSKDELAAGVDGADSESEDEGKSKEAANAKPRR